MPGKKIKFPKIILAPLSDVSDLPFRLLNRSFGCKFAYCQMVSSRALVNNKPRTEELLKTHFRDRPLGIQLLANTPEILKKTLFMLRSYRHDTVDLNAGCPTPKVAKKGQGAGLLKDLERLKTLIETLARFSDKPATIKIRTGWSDDCLVAIEIAKMAEAAGLSAIFIHGRTRQQGYDGSVDYQTIREVKEAVKIPVIASGNIFSGELAKKMFDETGCDGIMVARGSLGNPWIFKEIDFFLKTGRILPRPTVKQLKKVIKKHLILCSKFYGEKIGVLKFRKHFSWYARNLRYSRSARNLGFSAKSIKELYKIIDQLQ
jgi:tRNA-dihydrouridine synthase B